MYLSKLELNGFKSFADTTSLSFDEGVTAIVGPNGCGKSNIVDAVRWVIGEQRPTALRSQKMENVIFNGTEKRKSLGMAEVELTIQNNRGVLPTEYSEVSLGRRLFRSGESEYLMNGTQCRLKDITELFMDTGMGADAYSVIELNMIDEILSDNAQDRRRLFEEASGITKYKQRRRQSLRKLENTQADLTRIRDLTDEISSSVRRLKRQAGKAETYNELNARLQKLELYFAQSTFAELSSKQEYIASELEEIGKRIVDKEQQIASLESDLKSQQEDLTRRENVVREREKSLQTYRDRAKDLKADIRLQEERIKTAKKALNRLKEEEASAEGQAEDLRQLKNTLLQQQETTAPILEKAEQKLEEAKSLRNASQEEVASTRAALNARRSELEDAQRKRANQQRELDRLENRIELKEEDIERTQRRASTFKSRGKSLNERVVAAQKERDTKKKQLDEAQKNLEAVREAKASKQDQLDEARQKLRTAEREQDAAQAEVHLLENLLNSFEEFSDAVQFLADDGSWSDQRIRTVADVLACDPEHRVALETALGELASCIVAADTEEARRALTHLRSSGEGQATFIILSNLSQPGSAETSADAATPLRDLVRVTDDDCGNLADVLLHNTYLAATLSDAQDAITHADSSAICITPEGEWVNAKGVVHGGSKRDQPTAVGGRIGRREQLAQARQELEKATSRLKKRQSRVNDLLHELEQLPVKKLEGDVETAREEHQEASRKLQQVQYAHESHQERRAELTERTDELKNELEQLQEEKNSLRQQAATLTSRTEELQEKVSETQSELETAVVKQRDALDAYNDARLAAVEARNKAETIERDLKRASDRLEELTGRAARRKDEIKEQIQTIESSRKELDQRNSELDNLRDKQPEREKSVTQAREQAKDTRQTIEESQSNLRALRKKREQLLGTKNEHAVERAGIDTRLEDLRERILDDYEQTLENLSPAPADFDADKASQEIKSLKNKISRMGSVNPLAVEEYEEKKERLDFLTEQQEDLEKAEDTLLETITEINRTAAARFDETFSAIQANFSKLFVRLFGEGASARLTLEESNDPLDADINILAQPAGKKPNILTQLSGGEKALTAIALLFAIYLVKPSPFCILDEVDAPLDDTNVQRFMNLIRDFEDDTQFILVTHDKHTMSNSDRMYGVTMQEQGVSTLVSVQFDEALAMAES